MTTPAPTPDWERARLAAERIIAHARSAQYKAPEQRAFIAHLLKSVCIEIDEIAVALHLMPVVLS